MPNEAIRLKPDVERQEAVKEGGLSVESPGAKTLSRERILTALEKSEGFERPQYCAFEGVLRDVI